MHVSYTACADCSRSIACPPAFASAFSPLASLEQLPLTRVKLDRSLIATIDSSARSLAIARAIVGLCGNLGLEVTAEGIERPEQLALLARFSGLAGQGYL